MALRSNQTAEVPLFHLGPPYELLYWNGYVSLFYHIIIPYKNIHSNLNLIIPSILSQLTIASSSIDLLSTSFHYKATEQGFYPSTCVIILVLHFNTTLTCPLSIIINTLYPQYNLHTSTSVHRSLEIPPLTTHPPQKLQIK